MERSIGCLLHDSNSLRCTNSELAGIADCSDTSLALLDDTMQSYPSTLRAADGMDKMLLRFAASILLPVTSDSVAALRIANRASSALAQSEAEAPQRSNNLAAKEPHSANGTGLYASFLH
jgi:hypothetical protein